MWLNTQVFPLARSPFPSPSPAAAARGKVARCYSGPLTSRAVKAMVACDSSGPLVIHVAKLYAESDGQSFSAFGRIYSGTVRPGELVSFPLSDVAVLRFAAAPR